MTQTGERNTLSACTAMPTSIREYQLSLCCQNTGRFCWRGIEGDLLAAIMVFALGDTAWYLYGASARVKSNLIRDLRHTVGGDYNGRSSAAAAIMIFGACPIMSAAALEAGFQERSDGLWGVYGFKRGWGGEVRRSLGAWDKSAATHFLYAAYRAALALKRLERERTAGHYSRFSEIDKREDWNARLRDLPNTHVLQTWEWGEFKRETSRWTPLRLAFERRGRVVAMASLLTRKIGTADGDVRQQGSRPGLRRC